MPPGGLNMRQYGIQVYFPQTFIVRNVAYTPRKKASALRKFKMAMKQPTLATFHFKNLSNDQDKPSPSTSGENTLACQGFFFFTKKVTRIFGVFPSANFSQQKYFPRAINFFPRNQFSILCYKVLLRNLVNKPTARPKDQLQNHLRCK